MHIVTSTDILLPRAEDMGAWSVIACDQFIMMATMLLFTIIGMKMINMWSKQFPQLIS